MVLSGEVGGGGAPTPNTADGRELSTSTQVGLRVSMGPNLNLKGRRAPRASVGRT